MYALAITIHRAFVVTYQLYYNTFIGKVYFFVSWIFWLYFVISVFAIWYMLLVALVSYERNKYISKKFYNFSLEKISKTNQRNKN